MKKILFKNIQVSGGRLRSKKLYKEKMSKKLWKTHKKYSSDDIFVQNNSPFFAKNHCSQIICHM